MYILYSKTIGTYCVIMKSLKRRSIMYVKDLSDNEYIVQCSSISERELNGNQTLSAIITPTASNRYFIDNIAEMWSIYDFDNVEHKIVYVKRRGEGDKLVVRSEERRVGKECSWWRAKAPVR